MVGRDQGAGLGRVVAAVAQADQVRAPADLLDEPVVDLVLDDRPAAGAADLAGVDEGGGQGVVDGGLEVGVGEDDVGALAAELEGDALDVDGGAPEELAAGFDAAGQGDQVHVGGVGERLADAPTRAQDEVDDARRRAGLLEESREVDRGERRDLGGFHDRGVARREGRGDLPGELEERVVPRAR